MHICADCNCKRHADFAEVVMAMVKIGGAGLFGLLQLERRDPSSPRALLVLRLYNVNMTLLLQLQQSRWAANSI